MPDSSSRTKNPHPCACFRVTDLISDMLGYELKLSLQSFGVGGFMIIDKQLFEFVIFFLYKMDEESALREMQKVYLRLFKEMTDTEFRIEFLN